MAPDRRRPAADTGTDTGRPLLAVDAKRLARPFAHFLAVVLALGLLFLLLAASDAVSGLRLVLAYGAAATAMIAVLVVRLRRAARDHGHPVAWDDVLYEVPARDLAGAGIAAAGLGTAAVVLLGSGGTLAGPGDVRLWLATGGVALAAAGVLRALRVRLLVTADAVLRAPLGGGVANRYPLDELQAVEAGRRLLRLRTGFLLADWSCIVDRPEEVEALVADLREGGAPPPAAGDE